MKTIATLGVVLVLATTAPLALVGCAGNRYEQSTGEFIDDKATNHRVEEALEDDRIYKFPNVKVTTFKGTVQLSGFVATNDQKDRAADIARKIVGVRDVVNNITVQE